VANEVQNLDNVIPGNNDAVLLGTITNPKLVYAEATSPEPSVNSYAVLGATSEQEALVRAQIRIMQPDVYPLRVLFVPHWKYIDTARLFRLHLPAGYTSAMFTHLPSRSVFIDSDRYVSDDSLGYWVAHELGHLAANSANESDADKVAREYRKRLKQARTERRSATRKLSSENSTRSFHEKAGECQGCFSFSFL